MLWVILITASACASSSALGISRTVCSMTLKQFAIIVPYAFRICGIEMVREAIRWCSPTSSAPSVISVVRAAFTCCDASLPVTDDLPAARTFARYAALLASCSTSAARFACVGAAR
jgi:hypothetical protein